MAVLRNSGPTVTLEVEYDLNGPSFHRPPPATTLQRCAEIVLEEDAPETNGQNNTEQGLFGVTLRGGAYGPDPTKSRPLTVTAIRMGSSAHREGRLRIGDRILAISGLDVSNRTLATAQNLLRGDIVQFPSQKGSPRSKVTHLTVEYDVSVLATLRKARGPLLLEVEKVPGVDFGLVLAIKKPKMNTIRHGSGQTGKVAPMQQKIRSIFVQGIVRASVADRCGAIHVGDELLAVDGISLELTGSLAEVYQLLRSQCPILRLELLPSNQVAPSSPLICEGSPVIPRHHSPAFLSHNTGYRSAAQGSASGSDQKDGRAVARKVIRPNTVLHKRVDSNTSTSSCSPPDVKERNRKFPFPAPQDRHNAAMGNSISNLDSNPRKSRNGLSTSRSPPRRAKPKAAVPQMSTSLYNGNIGSVSERPFENKFPLSTSVSGSISARLVPTTIGSSLSHLSSNGIPMGQVCHAETMEVVLYKGSDRDELAGSVVGHLGRTTNSSFTCFGITLDRVPSPGDSADDFGDESHPNIGPVFISAIQKESPADKSGVLQVGDRVISINDWFTANGTLEEAIHVLSHCQCVGGINASVSLLVEFDVIESVLPPSGLFMVKLAKRGNNLGIVCKSETNNEKGEPVVISDIRTGSVAHRCGSIQLGDRIHSIDGISLESCTVEESMRLLQRSGNVVKLCILKGNADDQDQDSQANNFITFAIELSRKSQPLGITIASTPGQNNPVIISQLAPGGLAERTGAMRVGDRILSINGEILEGKKGVAQAINILQQSTDVVSIKLCRNITAETSPVLPNFGWRCSSSGLMNPGMIGMPLSTIPSDSVSDGSEKIETPLKSVDSAVESLELEDSSDGVHTKSKCGQHFQHNATRPSTSHCYYHPDVISGGSSEHWDSGLSSAADSHTATQPITSGMGNGPGSNGDRCCSCSQGTPKSNPTTNSNSPGGASDGMSKKSEEDWMRILEALETVGEEEMLKKLEESIMSYGKALSNTPSKVQPQIPTRREDPPRSLHFPPLQSSRETNPGVFSRSIQQNHLATHSGDPYSRQLSSPISTSNSNYYTSIAQPSTSSGILDQSTSSIIYKSQQSNSGTDRSGADPATPVPPHRTMIGRSLAEHMNGQSSNYATIQTRLTNPHIQHANPGFSVIGEQIGSVYPLPSSHRSISNGSFYEERKSGHSTLESGTGTANSLPPAMPSPKPKPIGGLELFPGSSHFNTPKSPLLSASRAHSNESPIPYITSPVPGASKDPRNATLRGEVNIVETPGSSGEIISVSLGKDPRTRSFGFSVSDGDAENPGIFVNSVIPGSPADGVVCPMDKVLQINQTSIQFLDCDLAVPLLSTDRVDLLLLRKPQTSARSNVNRNIATQPKMTHPRGPCLQSPL